MGGKPRPQRNKPHKPGRNAAPSTHKAHRRADKGNEGGGSKSSAKGHESKYARQQRAKAMRQQKRSALLEAKRSGDFPPKVIAVITVTEGTDTDFLLNELVNEGEKRGKTGDMDVEPTCSIGRGGVPFTVTVPHHKERLSFFQVPTHDPMLAADAMKMADVCLDVVGIGVKGSQELESVLQAIRLQGPPPAICALRGLKPMSVHDRSAAKKSAADVLEQTLQHKEVKQISADDSTGRQELLRHLCNLKPHDPLWRAKRPYVIPESLTTHQSPDSTDGHVDLVVSGYVRGASLSADQLVHLPNKGEYQIRRIDHLKVRGTSIDPNPLKVSAKSNEMEFDGEVIATRRPDPEEQEPLIRENEPNEMDMDQTWPTNEEMEMAATGQGGKALDDAGKRRRKLPPGTSSYQASWLLDALDDEDEDEGSEDEGENDAQMNQADANMDEQREADDNESEERGTMYSEALSGYRSEEESDEEVIDRARQENERRKKEREAMEDAEFPDEVEAPEDRLASERFSKYRGLKSFRTTPWHPKADLPHEYNRIFAFDNLRRAQKQATETHSERAQKANAVPPGSYVRVSLANVEPKVVEHVNGKRPFVALGLLQHEGRLSVIEQKMSLLEGEEALKGKSRIVFDCGFRRMEATPIFSTDDTGDKHKLLRFLYPGVPAVASFYGPITYPPAPGLAFRYDDNESKVCGVTNCLGPGPWRVVVKRIILTGVPVKVQKKKATVRHMFHYPEDVRYFKPLDVWTKGGMRGSIKEPVGTHGAMKCRFNAPVLQHDTVCLSLYKRVFPPYTPSGTVEEEALPDNDER